MIIFRLNGTRSGLPISVNWIFFATCYAWGATSEYLLKIGDFAPTVAGWPKILGRKGAPPPPTFFFPENYATWYFVWYKNLDRSFFRFVTIHAFDRRTDRRADGYTAFSSLDRVCIACSAVKIFGDSFLQIEYFCQVTSNTNKKFIKFVAHFDRVFYYTIVNFYFSNTITQYVIQTPLGGCRHPWLQITPPLIWP